MWADRSVSSENLLPQIVQAKPSWKVFSDNENFVDVSDNTWHQIYKTVVSKAYKF